MTTMREDHLRDHEARARRTLEHHARRWPTNPNVFHALLVVMLVVIALIAI